MVQQQQQLLRDIEQMQEDAQQATDNQALQDAEQQLAQTRENVRRSSEALPDPGRDGESHRMGHRSSERPRNTMDPRLVGGERTRVLRFETTAQAAAQGIRQVGADFVLYPGSLGHLGLRELMARRESEREMHGRYSNAVSSPRRAG